MTQSEYQELAKRTCPSLGSEKLDLSHMVMGMCSELSELSDAYDKEDAINATEEFGDVLWYLANYSTLRRIQMVPAQIIVKSLGGFKPVDWYIHELTDLVKKYVAYNKLIPLDKEIDLIVSIHDAINTELYEMGIKTIEKVRENNINKLKIRYPEKFTEENAITRNLEAEREELEK